MAYFFIKTFIEYNFRVVHRKELIEWENKIIEKEDLTTQVLKIF